MARGGGLRSAYDPERTISPVGEQLSSIPILMNSTEAVLKFGYRHADQCQPVSNN
jgi:hypothetical protein